MQDDKRAFWARMFAKHHSALNGFFRRRIAHPWDAQDLAQEVYLRLLRVDSREEGEAIGNPEAYLYTVAANLVKEHGVLQKRQPASVDIAAVFPELEAPGGSAEDVDGPHRSGSRCKGTLRFGVSRTSRGRAAVVALAAR